MASQYDEYYVNQAGSGLTAYHGLQYQRGHGFFGTLFSSIIKPLGKYLGKQALNTGVKLGSDFLSGENFKDSFKKNIKLTGEKILDDGYSRAKKFAQSGKGRKRRRRRKPKKVDKSIIKVKKSNKKRRKRKTKSVKKRQSTRRHRKIRRAKGKRKKKKLTNFDFF